MMQLSPEVYALRIPFVVPTGPNTGIERFVYSYVILGERTWVIDTGVQGNAERIIELVAKVGRKAESISDIVLTHSHIDHMGSARELVARTQAKVHAHPAERSWIENVEVQARERPVPGFMQLVGGSVTLDSEIAHGDVLTIAPNLHLRVIHVPGHSPGSCALFLEEPGVLFSGDAVPVRGDMPVYDNPLRSARSLATLRFVRKLRVLASAWDEPKRHAQADQALMDGSSIIEDIHRAVVEQTASGSELDPIEFCRAVLRRLRLPEAMANPLVARTFQSHLAYRDRRSLVG